MAKIKVDLDKLIEAFPEAEGLKFLPRKKKKALKKKIAKMLIAAMTDYANLIIEETIFNEVSEKMDELMKEIDRLKEEKC